MTVELVAWVIASTYWSLCLITGIYTIVGGLRRYTVPGSVLHEVLRGYMMEVRPIIREAAWLVVAADAVVLAVGHEAVTAVGLALHLLCVHWVYQDYRRDDDDHRWSKRGKRLIARLRPAQPRLAPSPG